MPITFVTHDFNKDDKDNIVPDADPQKRKAVGKAPIPGMPKDSSSASTSVKQTSPASSPKL